MKGSIHCIRGEKYPYIFRGLYTYRAIDILLQAGVKTNVHYVLSEKTLKEAVRLLEEGGFREGINAAVFLLHKPIGLGRKEHIIRDTTPCLEEFFALIDRGGLPFKIGFDSCTVPGLLRYFKMTDSVSIDTCEGGRWSAYITPDMHMLPCSFDNQQMCWAVDLRSHSIEEAWNGSVFDRFRKNFQNACQIAVRGGFAWAAALYARTSCCADKGLADK